MKTENVIGLVGLVALAGFIAFVLARYQDMLPTTLGNTNASTNATLENTNVTATIALGNISTHATAADCWIIVRAKVYNVTDFLIRHPGGAFRVTPYCGTDATVAFETKGGTGTHSVIAVNELSALYVGEAATSAIAAPSNANANVSTFGNTNASTITTSTNTATSLVVLSAQTVALHNRSTDCWIIVQNGVYAVTSYLSKHPGGAARIVPYCGKDATTAFATQGGTGTHSSAATIDLAALRLGTLGSTTTTNTIKQVNTNTTATTPSGEAEREDEDDD